MPYLSYQVKQYMDFTHLSSKLTTIRKYHLKNQHHLLILVLLFLAPVWSIAAANEISGTITMEFDL